MNLSNDNSNGVSDLRKTIFFVFLLLFFFPLLVNAYWVDTVTFSSLPPHCKAKFANMYKLGKVDGIKLNPKKYNIEKWKSTVGRPWVHLHHYCPGLVNLFLARYGRESKFKNVKAKNRSKLLAGAKYQFMYTIRQSQIEPHNSWFFAEIYSNLGMVEFLNGKLIDSTNNYKKAIKLYKKYIPAYVGLSKAYKKQGRIEEAKSILEKAIKLRPNSKSLKRKLKKLGPLS